MVGNFGVRRQGRLRARLRGGDWRRHCGTHWRRLAAVRNFTELLPRSAPRSECLVPLVIETIMGPAWGIIDPPFGNLPSGGNRLQRRLVLCVNRFVPLSSNVPGRHHSMWLLHDDGFRDEQARSQRQSARGRPAESSINRRFRPSHCYGRAAPSSPPPPRHRGCFKQFVSVPLDARQGRAIAVLEGHFKRQTPGMPLQVATLT